MTRFGPDDGGGYWQQMQPDPLDRDGDGIADILQPPVGHELFGNPFGPQCWDFDQDGDGRPDCWAFDTDRNGQIDHWAWDTDGDGRADHWAWDDNQDGRADRWAWDMNGDGQHDQWAWDTDGDGQIDQRGYDTNGNGKPDSWTSDHDRDGKTDTWLHDTTGNGRIDRWVYDRDGDGRPDWWASDKNGDGRPDYWEKDSDRDGVADRYAVDVDNDGKPDRWLRFAENESPSTSPPGPVQWRTRGWLRRRSDIPRDPLMAKDATIDRLVLNAYSMCPSVCKHPAFNRITVAAAKEHARNAKVVTLTKAQWTEAIRHLTPDIDPEAVGGFVKLRENTICLPPAAMDADLGLDRKQLKELRADRIGHERWHILLHKLGIPIDADSKTKWKRGPLAGQSMSIHHAVLFRAGNY